MSNVTDLKRIWDIRDTQKSIQELQALQWELGYSESRCADISCLRARLALLLEDPPAKPVRPRKDYPHPGWMKS
jgi:hypothetical protein